MSNDADRLARGESVPGGPGACGTCGHLTLWHMNGQRRYRGKPCLKCDCRAFTGPGENAVLQDRQCGSPRKPTPRKTASGQPGQLALFTLEEVS